MSVRRWWWLLLAFLVVLGLVRLKFDAEVLNLLPPSLPEVKGLVAYQEYFDGSNDLLITLEDREVRRFMGIIATASVKLGPTDAVQRAILLALPPIGLAGLAALGIAAWKRPVDDRVGLVVRLTFWTLLLGWLMTMATRGAVFDRYLAPWGVALPIAWVCVLPRRWRWMLLELWLQIALLGGIAGYLTWVWLVR